MTVEQDEVVRVAEMFGAVARSLASHESAEATLDKVVRLAVVTVGGCEYAGITKIVGRDISSPASSSDIPRIVDEIQAEVGEGPCLDAIREHEVFQTGDLAAEARWPQFAARAHAETGVTSVLSLRLFVEEDTMGALNLYSTARDAFDDTDLTLGSVFASHAAVAMSSAQREEHLERKAETRDLIGRAKGILMAHRKITGEEAFELLVATSQHANEKLRDIAAEVVRRGDLSDD